MRVGIVTFQSTPNYGAVLQAYALQEHLRRSGHETLFLRWHPHEEPFSKGLRGWVSWAPRKAVRKLYTRMLRETFRDFRDRHLRSSPEFYRSIEELRGSPPPVDVLLCGSDQVWSPGGVDRRHHPIVWLRFGDERLRRIAYAASFGVRSLDDPVRVEWSEYARGLQAISVREREGVDLVRTLGRPDAQWVPDPTLLLTSADYIPIESRPPPGRPYLFGYVLKKDSNGLYARCRADIMRLRQLAVRECRPFYAPLRSLLTRNLLDPSQWLGQLRNADYVVTNSFHGLVFSLLFHRPFVVLLRERRAAGMNGRVESILRVAGLEDRAVAHYDRAEVDRLCREEIDWDAVDDRLAAFREVGQGFLRNALA